jgi:Na+/proline symporter
MYPLFVIEILGRFPGLTGLFISCILSATLSTFSSGVNSMATVILEDIYKRLTIKHPMTNEHELVLSKALCNYLLSFALIESFC